MASGQKKKPKGLPKRTGRRAAKYARYYLAVEKERKLRHLLRRNGRHAANEWAKAHGADAVLQRLVG